MWRNMQRACRGFSLQEGTVTSLGENEGTGWVEWVDSEKSSIGTLINPCRTLVSTFRISRIMICLGRPAIINTHVDGLFGIGLERHSLRTPTAWGHFLTVQIALIPGYDHEYHTRGIHDHWAGTSCYNCCNATSLYVLEDIFMFQCGCRNCGKYVGVARTSQPVNQCINFCRAPSSNIQSTVAVIAPADG
ncbi:hypothetical protein BD779DRAFT_1238240 [Infundibulicybe gibba]|nr:hypothetical protein BD779DRAFT_1238240 [Infundibulicybe gibba]